MKFKGRQIGFLVLLCSGWAVARIVLHSTPSHVVPSAGAVAAVPHPEWREVQGSQASGFTVSLMPPASYIAEIAIKRPNLWPIAPTVRHPKPSLMKQPDSRVSTRLPLSPSRRQMQSRVEQPLGQSSPTPTLSKARSRSNPFAEIYAYSYWRWDANGSGLAAAGQYGGSQSGLIVTVPLRGLGLFRNGENLAVLFRAVVTPDSRADREVAAGLRWRPLRAVPVTVSAERRFRRVGPDRVAIYIAGGFDEIELPAKFNLDSYAQGGFVSGHGAGRFFDASARVYRPFFTERALSLKAGGGAWAGGQTGTSRLDIGPSVSAAVPLGSTRLRIDADWRFRIAGNAHPGNGPALTLSTSF